MDKINELRTKRAKIYELAKALNDKAIAESRDLNAEEKVQYDRMWADMESLRGQIQRMETLAGVDADLRAHGEPVARADAPAGEKESRAVESFRHFLKTGERRDGLSAGTDSAGGYLFAPAEIAKQFILKLNDLLFVRQYATVLPLSSSDVLQAGSLSADIEDADWTGEVTTATVDDEMTFSKADLTPHPLKKMVKVSEKLLEIAPGAEGLVMDNLAYKFAVTEEKAFMSGNGSGKPLGLFIASASGINTDRDINTGNAATSIGADNIVEMLFGIKEQYRRKARWIAHRDYFKAVAKLKDGEGRYLWQPSLSEGQPDRLAGYPAHMSEYAPNTFTSAQYVAIFGDLSSYWIAESSRLKVRRLVELYAATSQVGFKGEMDLDGAPVNSAAFARAKMGT